MVPGRFLSRKGESAGIDTCMGRVIDWIRKLLGLDDPQPTPPPVPGDIESIKARLLLLHNQQRASHGLPALNRHASLDHAAQLHNDYMAQHDNLTHSEGWGRDVGVRVKEAGYNWSYVGENIAAGQSTADEVMSSWMNSSGHRANILGSHYRDVGFGVTHAGNGVWCWTTDFGSP
jgi:uncharacterized protein YkwD